MTTLPRDHLGRDETPAPPPGILVSDYYYLHYGYSTYRPSGTKDWLIMYTLSGHGIVLDNDRPLSCREGDMAIIPPHTPHIYYTAPDSIWEKMWCHFMPKPAWSEWLHLPIRPNPLIHLHIEDRFAKDHIIAAFNRLLLYNRSVIHPFWEELSLNALEEILLLTMSQTASSARNLDSRIKKVLNHLTHHYAQDWRVEDLAKMVCLSPSRLAHLFKEQVGETIFDVLIKLRLKQAERLLKFTTRQITEIAYDVGFRSPDYFTRKFKDYYSVNPSKFRHQFKSADSADN